jgi:hypothetical protein
MESATGDRPRHAVVAYDPRGAARRNAVARRVLPGLRFCDTLTVPFVADEWVSEGGYASVRRLRVALDPRSRGGPDLVHEISAGRVLTAAASRNCRRPGGGELLRHIAS